MACNIKVTASAERDLDAIISYTVRGLGNPQAAGHLPDEIAGIYRALADNPLAFPVCSQPLLQKYRKVSVMRYVVIYRVDGDTVYVERFFSRLEDYVRKL